MQDPLGIEDKLDVCIQDLQEIEDKLDVRMQDP
jgi:hypothetical protein